jgi:DNA adenine methylase
MSRGTIFPRPFLKWAGGKGQLLPDLLRRVAQAGKIKGYHEPFVGGGALFFELHRLDLLPHAELVWLSDTNPNLVRVWWAVQRDVDGLVERLRRHAEKHGEDYYYQVRDEAVMVDDTDRAARVIYLNKTCFNGLYRENSKGGFNVPFGRYANPTVCDEENLRACNRALQGVHIENRPFTAVTEHVRAGDLVYFDPPYQPLSATSSFTRYAKDGFGEAEQRALAALFGSLGPQKVKAVLSNSWADLVVELYTPWRLEEVLANRNVNRDATRRGKIAEALVCNFDEQGKIRPPRRAPTT